MALTPQDIDYVRVNFTKEIPPRWLKPTINAAIEAVETVLTSASLQTALSNAIDAATDPIVLDGTEKRKLVKWVLKSRFDRDNS